MIDWFFALPINEQWTTARDWLATVGGLAALAVATATYVRNVRQKRREAARLVYATERRTVTYLAGAEFKIEMARNDVVLALNDAPVEFAQMDKSMAVRVKDPIVRSTIVVHNGSKERISPAYAHAFSLSANRRIADSPPIDNVDPGAHATLDLLFPMPPEGRPEVAASLVFRDSSGLWWQRHLSGPLRRARRVKDPSVRGTYWQHDSSVQDDVFKQDETEHAVGVFTKNVVLPPSVWQRLRARSQRSNAK